MILIRNNYEAKSDEYHSQDEINWNQKHDIDFEVIIFLIQTKTQKNLSQKAKIMNQHFLVLDLYFY